MANFFVTSLIPSLALERGRPRPQRSRPQLRDTLDGQVDEQSYQELNCDMDVELSTRVKFEVLSSINEVNSTCWDACVGPSSSPFVQHAWLQCLEDSGCASSATGWTPHHIRIRLGRDICGFVPCYVKDHSMGEFIFDNTFAYAAQRNGLQYYPKLLVGVPFTPVTGSRILLNSKLSTSQAQSLRKLVSIYLKKVAADQGLSSVHINFAMDDEIETIAGPIRVTQDCDSDSLDARTPTSGDNSPVNTIKAFVNQLNLTRGVGGGGDKQQRRVKDNYDNHDYLRRTSIQYHWHNSNTKTGGQPYASFEEYLSCFKSKRRISIKREREKVKEEEGIRIDAVVGRNILKYDGLVDRMYLIYRSTVDKMLFGRQYLSLDFFRLLAKSSFVDNLCFMCARRLSSGDILQAKDVMAGTFNCVKDNVFYGRYWGCLDDVKNLHFETCYWSALEYCIQEGLTRMEPGAGGGGESFVA